MAFITVNNCVYSLHVRQTESAMYYQIFYQSKRLHFAHLNHLITWYPKLVVCFGFIAAQRVRSII